jgi:multisubunit Na+/H+ antiporter MnhB subunit
LQQGQIRSSVKIGTILGLLGLLVAYLSSRLLGQMFYARFSSYYVEYSLSLRYQETYQYVVPDLLQYTLGLGQGLWLYSVGGGAGLARLVVEGGLPGLIFLGNSFAVLWITLIRLVKTCRRALEGSLVAAVIATLVSLYNYVNITDLWIWVVLSLPFVALNTRNQETVQFQNLRDPNAL